MKNSLKRRPSLIKALLLITLLLALWLPRGLALDRFVTIDEPRWLMRSANFYRALYHGDLKKTFQREHPGVTITWAGTAGFLWRFPGYIKVAQKQLTSPTKLQKLLREYERHSLELLKASRILIVLAIVTITGLAFLYAIKLIGLIPSLVGFLLIAFDPYSIALSRLLHLDGLVSALMLLSLLAFMNYLYRGSKTIDLLISAIAAGLSWLTKSPALFLAPFMGLLVLIELIATWRKTRHLQFNDLWHNTKPLLIWFGVGSFVFVILWPAMWVDPVGTLSSMFTQVTDYALEGNINITFFNGQIFDSGDSAWYFYPISYLWRTTPPVLIGCVLAMLGLIFHRELKTRSEWLRAIWILTLFAVLYTLLISLGGKKSDRYLLPVHSPLILVATLGWFIMLQAIQERFAIHISPTKLRIGTIFLLGVIIFIQLIGVLQTFPYYFNYYNPLMGGSKNAARVMMIGWGEGLDQAAQYLNTVPGAEKLRVIAWYREGSFSYFFNGSPIGMENDDTIEILKGADYVVLYIHQWQRQIPSLEVLDFFDQLIPEYTVKIGDFEYAKIYNMHEAPDPASSAP